MVKNSRFTEAKLAKVAEREVRAAVIAKRMGTVRDLQELEDRVYSVAVAQIDDRNKSKESRFNLNPMSPIDAYHDMRLNTAVPTQSMNRGIAVFNSMDARRPPGTRLFNRPTNEKLTHSGAMNLAQV